MTNELTPVAKALLAAERYHRCGEYSNEDQRHVVALALEIARLSNGIAHSVEPAAPRAGIPGPVSISYGTAQDALEAMEKLAEQGAYKHLRADDASFVRRALAELRSVLNRPAEPK